MVAADARDLAAVAEDPVAGHADVVGRGLPGEVDPRRRWAVAREAGRGGRLLGVGRAGRHDQLGPIGGGLARAEVDAVARGAGEAEAVRAVAGHERRDVVLDPGVGRRSRPCRRSCALVRGGRLFQLTAVSVQPGCGREDGRPVHGAAVGVDAQLGASDVPAGAPVTVNRRRLSTAGFVPPSTRRLLVA